jgi:MFS superfamily sulfate permease-like transporter
MPQGRGLRLDRHELAGGLGDTGLMIPIAVAFVTVNGLSATAVFAGVGIAYMATASVFRVPLPVQPLKAFAAAAIALGLSAATIAAGALLMAVAMATLAVTGLATWLAARFPLVLVRGIQASVALLLAKAALELAQKGNWDGLTSVDGGVSIAIALGACVLLFASSRARAVPGTLVVLAAGAVAGIAISGLPSDLSLGPDAVSMSLPPADSFATALSALFLAQLPLTFGNSIVATADAEREYYGERARRVTPRRLAVSIGAGNLYAGLCGGLPICHGAGGVTAHYKLGARTAAATMAAGALFLAGALLFGSSLPALLRLLLPGALAGMLLYIAIQHGLLAARLETGWERGLAAGVGVVTLASGNLAIGFAAGAAVLAAAALWRRSVWPKLRSPEPSRPIGQLASAPAPAGAVAEEP